MQVVNCFNRFVTAVVSTRWLFFAFWTAWITLEFWALGPGSYLRVHDNANTHIPFAMEAGNSYSGPVDHLIRPWLSGMDRLANFGWWNLFYLPFAFLPTWLAHGIITFIQRFVAGYFTARLMQDCLGTRKAIAYAAGMVYSLAHTDLGEVCFMHMLNEPGLPLLLWAFCRMPLHRPTRSLSYSSLLGIGLGWAMSGLIGIYFLVPAAFLFVWVSREDVRSVRTILILAICFGVFCVVALARQIPEIWALLMHAKESFRAKTFGIEYGNISWNYFWSDRLRYFTTWWPFVVLTLVWFWNGRLQGRANRAIALLLFIGVVFGPMMGPLKTMIAPYIGFLRGVDFTRFHMVSALAWTMAAISAVALLPAWNFSLRNTRGEMLRSWNLVTLISALVGLFALIWSVNLKQDHFMRMVKLKQTWRSLYEHPDIGKLAGDSRPEGYRFATAGAHFNLHPGYWLSYGADMADGHSPMYSDRYYQFWTSVIRPLISIDHEVAGKHTWGSYVYLHHARVGKDYESLVIPFQRWYDLELLSLAGVRYIIADKEIADERLSRIVLPEQDRMIVEWDAMSRSKRIKAYLTAKTPPRHLYAYENKQAFPRFFLVQGIIIFDDKASMLSALEEASVDDLTKYLYIMRDDLNGVMPPASDNPEGRVELVVNETSRLVAEVDLAQDQILVCGNQFFRWWRWKVDGKPVEKIPAYGAFMAAIIPAGKHIVELTYEPPYGELVRRLDHLVGRN